MKNKQSLGIILFAIALLINRFLPANNLLDFIAGFLTGLSIVFNLSCTFNRSRRKLSC
jgi:hypothetical protein